MVSAKHIKLSLKVSQANRGNIFHSATVVRPKTLVQGNTTKALCTVAQSL